MQVWNERRFDPELKRMVREASQWLARLDAQRLEDLALCCRVLIGDLKALDAAGRAELARQARDAVGEMATYSRVLEATRANLNVMNRLRELRQGRLEYRDAVLRIGRRAVPEASNGNN